MNFILLILFTTFNTIMCQDDFRPEEFGFYFVHKPEKLSPEVFIILDSVVKEYNTFYHYTNITQVCPTVPTVTCPTVTCPPPVVMDTECPTLYPSNDPDSVGFFVSILLITLVNLGLLVFTIWKGYELFKTKINPFKVRVDPLTQTTSR